MSKSDGFSYRVRLHVMTNREKMYRLATTTIRTFVALLLIVTVATILITPDPTDDVNGLVHPQKIIGALSLISTPGLSLTLLLAARLQVTSSQHATSADLLRLICICRR